MLREVLDQLASGKGRLRCKEVKTILESLGFVVRRTKKGHYVYDHPGLPDFHGSNYACPHKSGDPVKKSYITNIIRKLRQHEAELLKHLGVNDE